jgi:hypothetical protein
MLRDNSSSARALVPAQFGKVKPNCAQDVVWGRPVFRAPELPAPRLSFEPLPLPAQFFGGPRSAIVR